MPDSLSILQDLRQEYHRTIRAIILGHRSDTTIFSNADKDSVVSVAFAHGMAHRAHNASHPILHASISCTWTMRSDRSQNTRTEALNLLRNRKGQAPHIVAVVMEPLPSCLASIALGTGDIDCTCHGALYELREAVRGSGFGDQEELLETLV